MAPASGGRYLSLDEGQGGRGGRGRVPVADLRQLDSGMGRFQAVSSGQSWTPYPPTPLPPPGPPERPVTDGRERDWTWAMALVFPATAFLLLTFAWGFLNNRSPEVGWAGFLLVLLAVLTIGAVWTVVYVHPDEHRRWLPAVLLPAGLVAVPLGMFLLSMLEDLYGMFGLLAFLITMGVVLLVVAPIYLILLLVAFIVRRTGRPRGGDRIAQVAGLITGGGFATAGILMLFTLRRQEELARQAHEAPGLGIMVLLFGVLFVVLVLRRARS